MKKISERDELRFSYAEKLLNEEEKADVRAKLPSSVDAIEMLKKDLSGYDEDFSYGILTQLGTLSLTKDPHGSGFLFLRSVLKEVRPGDRMGMLLLVQMLIVHDATISQSCFLASSKHLEQIERFANIVNKFARTFALQMDALQRYRSGPEPKLTVNNVSVGGGGQAIVGTITQNTGGGGTKDVVKPPLILTDQSGTAMPILDPDDQSAATVPRIEQDQEPAPGTTKRRRRA